MRYAEALARLEARAGQSVEILEEHDSSIVALEKTVDSLQGAVTKIVAEVKHVRNAIYLMAGVLTLNIPETKSEKLMKATEQLWQFILQHFIS